MSKIQRYASLIGLKKEYEERYIILHKHVFPGVLDRIRKCNIHNYSIFLHNGILFAYYEYTGSDYQADMAAMADEITREWWKLTDPMQVPLDNRKEGEWWASMELLYQMDSSKVPYENVKRYAYSGDIKTEEEQKFKERLKHIDSPLIQLVLDANMQNVTVCAKDKRIYLYYEYVGDDFSKDLARLRSSEPFQKLNSEMKKLFKPVSDAEPQRYLQEIQEVFHTN